MSTRLYWSDDQPGYPSFKGVIGRGAVFSPDLVYRYLLWRVWDPSKPIRVWIMLNPSTADEVENDPTVERCERRSVQDGFGGMVVVNIFGLRSTDPLALYDHRDPIGPNNDRAIVFAAEIARQVGGQIVIAWGTHGECRKRGVAVIDMLWEHGFDLAAIKKTKSGHPVHPLYQPYELKPTRFSL